MISVNDTLTSDDYDEFGLLHENAAEWNLPFHRQPVVARSQLRLSSGQSISYVRWGTEEPRVVFLHGGGQNAHTWDTVALALDEPAVAVDLPGHGHSDRRPDRDYGPWQNADAVAALLTELAGPGVAVVGMSLGGATAIRLAARRPDLCHYAILVDVTPQINDATRTLSTAERGSVALIAAPPVYDSFETMASTAVAASPLRAASGVRRGVRHNATRMPDGRWTWRHDLMTPGPEQRAEWVDFTPLWDDVDAMTVPTLLVRGGLSRFVLDEDVAEMRRRLPAVRVEVAEGAGHAVQSDRPLELVRLIREFAVTGK